MEKTHKIKENNLSELTPQSPQDIFEIYYKEYPDSYKENIKIGKKAAFSLFSDFDYGIIIYSEDNVRYIEKNKYIYIQERIYNLFWLDMGCILKESFKII